MNDGILHDAAEKPEPMFQGGRLYSLLDILGGGRAVCESCGRWQSFSALTDEMAREALVRDGWTFPGGKDKCPKCSGGK